MPNIAKMVSFIFIVSLLSVIKYTNDVNGLQLKIDKFEEQKYALLDITVICLTFLL